MSQILKRATLPLLCCFGASLIAARPPAEVESEHPRIRIAEKLVPLAKEQAARRLCQENAPELRALDCIQDYWVPIWLLAAKNQRGQTPDQLRKRAFFDGSENRIFYQSLVNNLMQAPLSSEETAALATIKTELRVKMSRPERIRIAHLYVHDGLLAAELQTLLKKDLSANDFKELCRKHSKDESTYQSGGDLGFISPDGSSQYPEIQVPQELYLAAQTLADGEFSAKPVAVEGGFSLIQRRGSLPASNINSAAMKRHIDELAAMRLQVIRQRKLLEKLRKEHVTVELPLIKNLKLLKATANRQPSAEK